MRLDQRRSLFPSLLLVLMLSSCGDGADTDAFAHLQLRDGGFDSTHGLRYRFETLDGLTPAGPLHRTDRFSDVPYEISLGAFVSADAAVMLHAERVADGSGASNYDNLPPAGWPDARFRGGESACVDVPAEERDAEHDLRWLHDNGFDPAGRVLVQQFFATTEDHNDEIVVTLLRRVASCDDVTGLDALRSRVAIGSEPTD